MKKGTNPNNEYFHSNKVVSSRNKYESIPASGITKWVINLTSPYIYGNPAIGAMTNNTVKNVKVVIDKPIYLMMDIALG